MAKGTSFAEKAKKGAKKEKKFTVVKYIKSVVAEKSGAIRFQESLLKIPEDKNLDSYLKELEAGPIEEAPVEAAEEDETNSTLRMAALVVVALVAGLAYVSYRSRR